MKAVAVDLGGTNIKVAVVHRQQGILESLSTPTQAEQGQEFVLNRIAEAVHRIVGKHEVIGIGMGLPGMVSLDQTTVKYPPNLTGWQVVNVSEALTRLTNLPCKIENDANIAALGSLHFGKGRLYDNFIMITLGTGVGGGIIINRKLFKGSRGMAGELGHVIINFDGPATNAVTKGTVEAYLGQRFLSRLAAEELKKHPENPLFNDFDGNFEELEPLHLTRAANDGNRLAKDILYRSGEKLGYAIINYAHILDINTFIISGGVAQAGEYLFEAARNIVEQQMMIPFREGFEIIAEDLGNTGALLGAAGLAFDSFA